MAKLKANLYTANKGKKARAKITFDIPISLAQIIRNAELSQDQKINLVRSFSLEMQTGTGEEMEQISDQNAVILIMALEVGAL